MTTTPELRQQVDKVIDELRVLLLLAFAAPEGQPEQKGQAAPVSMETGYITIKELVKHFHVSKPTIYRWIREGKLPKGELLGKRLRRWKKEVII